MEIPDQPAEERPITDDDLARYHEDGFIVFESVVTEEPRKTPALRKVFQRD